ncbi:SpoIIE family protein phosphatase [Streptomyces lasalocidi]|uniref:Protein phosphatase n=1 Tax=Streptomyces lasalocidi TaxID=324833 RepID=A0A4U5WJQ1_STRLS|nr:SpoIIE family protein phosphatase [Streptomyces lasalocidi]TKT00726.1 protein phosphatase [Streptomyces lasalocidi]
MGVLPTQRETVSRTGGTPPARPLPRVRATLPGGTLAPGTARGLLGEALREWADLGLPVPARLAEDAVLVLSELVTNAVLHAGTDVDLDCRLAEPWEPRTGAARTAYDVVVEVSDRHPGRHPARPPADGTPEPHTPPAGLPEDGRGLRLVAALAEEWGVTYRRGAKTVWVRLPGAPGPDGTETTGTETDGDVGEGLPVVSGEYPAPAPGASRTPAPSSAGPTAPDARPAAPGALPDRDQDWLGRNALSFLAEASDLLAGQLDEDLVASLTGQLLVPRLADWCAVWLEDEVGGRGWGDGSGQRLARVRHGSEGHVEELRRALEKDPPRLTATPLTATPLTAASLAGPVELPWPGAAPGGPGAVLACRLVAGGRPLGTLVIGRSGAERFPEEVAGLVEDLSRRVALAVGAARQYARQATISAVLQRGLLPGAVAEIPGVRSALVYEPCDQGGPSGDFYDLFPAGDGRWCFAVGDVQGKGPEAAVVIGLARPWLRLLAREGYGVADVLDRLNQLLLDDATEAADAAARAFAGPTGPAGPADGPQTRFLSLLYGELVPFPGGVHCTLASAGHPLPLLLGPDGTVRTVAQPQTLLGVVEDVAYTSETCALLSGDSLLCVTDGVTERRSGPRQFDDGDGLAHALAGCAGLDADGIAARIRQQVHAFGGRPPEDDLALLVLQAE